MERYRFSRNIQRKVCCALVILKIRCSVLYRRTVDQVPASLPLPAYSDSDPVSSLCSCACSAWECPPRPVPRLVPLLLLSTDFISKATSESRRHHVWCWSFWTVNVCLFFPAWILSLWRNSLKLCPLIHWVTLFNINMNFLRSSLLSPSPLLTLPFPVFNCFHFVPHTQWND